MTTRASRDLFKLCAAGNRILVQNKNGIFEWENSLRVIEVLEQWFLIISLPIYVFVIFTICLYVLTIFVY